MLLGILVYGVEKVVFPVAFSVTHAKTLDLVEQVVS